MILIVNRHGTDKPAYFPLCDDPLVSGTDVLHTVKMAPDTSLQAFVNASAASLALPTIPTSPIEHRDPSMEGEENVDPDAKLILSDFTQSTTLLRMKETDIHSN